MSVCRLPTGVWRSLRWRDNGGDSVSNHQPSECLLNSPPAQMASNAENVSIWWRHHGCVGAWRPLEASDAHTYLGSVRLFHSSLAQPLGPYSGVWKMVKMVMWAHNYPESSGYEVSPSLYLNQFITKPATPADGRPCGRPCLILIDSPTATKIGLCSSLGVSVEPPG